MKRRTMLKGVTGAGLLALGATAGAATDDSGQVGASGCYFECCEDCHVVRCRDGPCECGGYCLE